MRKRAARLGGLTAAVLGFVLVGQAGAATLGLTSQPADSFPDSCFAGPSGPELLIQLTQDSSTPYFVPGAGHITQWQTDTVGDTAGAPITFLVLRHDSAGSYTVVGVDNENLPTPLPANGVASYNLSTPIAVTGGETLGLYSSAAGGPSAPTCYFDGGTTPTADRLDALVEPSAPAAGQTLSEDPDVGPSPGGFTLNVAATLVQQQDAGVTTAAGPSNATAGYPALLDSTVGNVGPTVGPITFTDTVPAGLTIDTAVAGDGTCTTSGQQVTCTISGLAAGDSVPVNIVVTPAVAGSYRNSVSVATTIADPNSANNIASALLTVGPHPPAPACVVPNLSGTPASTAKRVLKLLDCTIGTVRHQHSQRIGKGNLIRTAPKPGTYTPGQKIGLVVSGGPRRAHHSVRHAVFHRSLWLRRSA